MGCSSNRHLQNQKGSVRAHDPNPNKASQLGSPGYYIPLFAAPAFPNTSFVLVPPILISCTVLLSAY